VHDAVIPGDPVTSTLKRVSAEVVDAEEEDSVADMILGDFADATKIKGRRVTGTVPRDHLVAVQTPQAFRAELLRRAYAQPGLDGATDDAMLVERLGAEVIVVDGDPRNVKVTTPADLALVRALLRK
jgi:2-C-methyl-D-erythritol 4-phosphate cytidylyltransferase